MITEDSYQLIAPERDADEEVQRILLAASQHDLEALQPLLWTGSASVQDPETGFTPLHAAIAACEPDSPTEGVLSNGIDHVQEKPDDPAEIQSAVTTVQFLLQKGAIWNDLDRKDETPACMARRLGLMEIYNILVDAGVRAEMLFSRMKEYEQLYGGSDGDEEEEGEGEGKVGEGGKEGEEVKGKKDEPEETGGPTTTPNEEVNHSASTHKGPHQGLDKSIESPVLQYSHPTLATDASDLTPHAYLSSRLNFHPHRLLDEAGNGVMMSWESDIMNQTAVLLAPTPGLRVLNIGHGLGIIDTALQATAPHTHHIIEAHADVLARLNGDHTGEGGISGIGGRSWAERAGVMIHAGRWQDVLPRLSEQGVVVDAVYFDTFAEDYSALKAFFDSDGGVASLLAEGGRWGFFHGLGADRQVCYDVYTRIVEMDLREAGWEVDWRRIPVPDLEEAGEWEGVKRKYWALNEYRLPICTSVG